MTTNRTQVTVSSPYGRTSVISPGTSFVWATGLAQTPWPLSERRSGVGPGWFFHGRRPWQPESKLHTAQRLSNWRSEINADDGVIVIQEAIHDELKHSEVCGNSKTISVSVAWYEARPILPTFWTGYGSSSWNGETAGSRSGWWPTARPWQPPAR